MVYAGFTAFVLAVLALDLGVFHRKAHVVSVREAAVWSAVWVALALLFNYLFYRYTLQLIPQVPRTGGIAYVRSPAGARVPDRLIVEKALAVDNIFVFVVVFSYFAVPPRLPAPRAVLRHPRRAGVPGDLHLARRGALQYHWVVVRSSARS